MENENHLIKERKSKLKELLNWGVKAFPYSYEKTHSAKVLHETYSKIKPDTFTKDKVSVAGRIISLRKMGKVAFFDIQDESGRIQIHIRKDEVKDDYKVFNKCDIGDFVGIKGTVFSTKTGELSILTQKFTFLTKSLLPLPDKHYGLKDPELRYRKRYLDLIINPEEKNRFETRTKIISYVREFLNNLNFLEVETPVLQVLYGGTNAKPFKTHINAYDMQMYLRVAPELYLKRLVVGGFERVYEIARNFRNEGVDQTHNPEFTMIEWYEAYADYNVMMDRAEAMYKFIAKKLFGKEQLTVHGKKIDISNKWPRIPLKEAIKKYVKIDVDKLNDSELKDVLKKHKLSVVGKPSRGIMIFTIFDKLVTDYLTKPVWIIDYPKEVSPLSKVHRDNPDLVERFECYIGGKEIGDGWSEIVNPIAQRERFENEQAAMRAGNDEAHPMDKDFIEAMEYGMPPLGGIGVGIDRLVMLFTDHWAIRDVIFFPIMRPKEEEKVGKAKDTKIAVALINKGIKMKKWEELNTIAHLNAAFGARIGRSLFLKDEITTKDDKKIKLNIQHAIMIKTASSNKEIRDLIKTANEKELDVAEFTREMIETTDDKKVSEMTFSKKLEDVEYLGVLIFGKKKLVDKLTEKFKLY